MTAYAIARMRAIDFGPDIVEYLRRIDATLEPYGGRFVVHGGAYRVLEGEWSGDTIVIAFPDGERAHAWYDSPVYREIIALRTDHSTADLIIVEGVGEGYRGEDALAKLLPAHEGDGGA
ncbi:MULTISPECIES: DUF1330 domain-containing protein [Kitasatospora]|uniref:DUF1330 domain-containing protein n=1 Tax=Kitasatospora arboriphila TaxID=258052 RepID=A0ABN1THB9_9ACTN